MPNLPSKNALLENRFVRIGAFAVIGMVVVIGLLVGLSKMTPAETDESELTPTVEPATATPLPATPTATAMPITWDKLQMRLESISVKFNEAQESDGSKKGQWENYTIQYTLDADRDLVFLRLEGTITDLSAATELPVELAQFAKAAFPKWIEEANGEEFIKSSLTTFVTNSITNSATSFKYMVVSLSYKDSKIVMEIMPYERYKKLLAPTPTSTVLPTATHQAEATTETAASPTQGSINDNVAKEMSAAKARLEARGCSFPETNEFDGYTGYCGEMTVFQVVIFRETTLNGFGMTVGIPVQDQKQFASFESPLIDLGSAFVPSWSDSYTRFVKEKLAALSTADLTTSPRATFIFLDAIGAIEYDYARQILFFNIITGTSQ